MANIPTPKAFLPVQPFSLLRGPAPPSVAAASSPPRPEARADGEQHTGKAPGKGNRGMFFFCTQSCLVHE